MQNLLNSNKLIKAIIFDVKHLPEHHKTYSLLIALKNKGYKTGVVANYELESFHNRCKELMLNENLDMIIDRANDRLSNTILNFLKLKKEEILVIADNKHAIELAHEANIKVFGFISNNNLVISELDGTQKLFYDYDSFQELLID